MPAALRDTCCVFGPQINTKSQNYQNTAKQTRGAAVGGGGGGGSQMLSLAISPSICSRILATLKTDTFYSHMTHVWVKIEVTLKTRRQGRYFLVGAQPALIYWRSLIGQTDQSGCQNQANVHSLSGPVVIGPSGAARCALTVMGCEENLAGSRLACCSAHWEGEENSLRTDCHVRLFYSGYYMKVK